MPRFDVDLTQVDVISGEVEGVVQKLEYQIKTGEKWNNAGTSTVEKDVWENHPDGATARIHLTIAVPGKGNLFHDLYFSDKAMPMTKRALKQMGVVFTPQGYNPDDALNAHIGMTVTVEEQAGYEPRSNIAKFYKA